MLIEISRLFIIILFLTSSSAMASELVLNDGRVIDGKILERTPKYIKLDIDGGLGRITYYSDEIDTVDGQKFQIVAPPYKSVAPVTQHIAVQPQPAVDGNQNSQEQINAVNDAKPYDVLSAIKDKSIQDAPVKEEETTSTPSWLRQDIAQNSSLYHSDYVGVTINVPNGWKLEESHRGLHQSLSVISPPSLIRMERSTIYYDRPDGLPDKEDIELEKTAVKALLFSSYLTKSTSFHFKNERAVFLKGLKVYAADFSLDSIEKVEEVGSIYIFYKGGYKFTINVFCLKEKVDKNIGVILDSISINTSNLKGDSSKIVASSFFTWVRVILFLIYMYLLCCTFFIARKLNFASAWWAWVPFTHPFLICKIIKVSYWWVLGVFISLTCLGLSILTFPLMLLMFFIIFPILVSYKIIKILKKPDWLIVWTCIPLINYIIWGYLAFCE